MDPARRRLLVSTALSLSGSLVARRADATTPDAPAPPPAPTTSLTLVAAPMGAEGSSRLSYDGSANGPVVRIAKGTELAVTLTNRLAEPTGLQWHGMRAPNAVDGNAPLVGKLVAPGETAQLRFVPPDSGVTWFHPPALSGLSDQTASGLRGVLIVEEPEPPRAGRDLLLTLADVAGSVTANGAPPPWRDTLATGSRLRLRLLNAGTGRIMVLALEGARPKVVAIDGQPSDLFEPVRDAVPVGPGARFEMLLDAPANAGAIVRLLLRGASLGEGARAPDIVLMELTTAGAPGPPLPPIAALPPNPMLPAAIPLERSVRADCVVEAVAGAAAGAARWRLNGVAALEPGPRPLLSVPRGGAVTLGFDNRGSAPVPLRVHGHVVRLLHAKDDGWEPYWRDSVILPPGSTNHVAFLADNPGRWLIESAAFDQAAFGLRTWFEVT